MLTKQFASAPVASRAFVVLGYFSNAFTTTDGSSQAVVLVNADGLSLPQQGDVFNAVTIGICGSG